MSNVPDRRPIVLEPLTEREWVTFVAGALHEDGQKGHSRDIEECRECSHIERVLSVHLPRLRR